ncbi:MAG: hypothetical protein IKT41_01375 [Clostridia bacterium]|nr:hypothetical protein [Clostridia bacterium]
MENASKALIMAGSILIALLTIGALMFMFDNISGVEKQKNQNAEIEAVLEFNRQFEAFDTVGLRGSDLLTVINKMSDYNKRSNDVQVNRYPTMSMRITFGVDTEGPFTNNVEWNVLQQWFNYDEDDKKFKTSLTGTQPTEFKRKYFKCTNVEYDNNTGRVIKMEFKEIDVK